MMNVAPRRRHYAYARGEEVLAHLSQARVYHVRGGGQLSEACVPPWTIGRIIGTRRPAGEPAYLLAFPHDDSDCVCWVAETAIEGVC